MSVDYIRQLVTSAAEANMNTLRIWGGGIYQRAEFYDICDELGILIWQGIIYIAFADLQNSCLPVQCIQEIARSWKM